MGRLAVTDVLGTAAMVVACVSAGCSRGAARTSGPARRVVSLSPSTTEALFAIGAGGAVVGRSRYDDYPPEVERLPSVGGYVDPSTEAVLALRPDLVTGARGPSGPAVEQRFVSRGIATYFPETESIREIDAMIHGLGERTGHVDGAAAVVASLDSQVLAVERAAAAAPRVRVLLVFGLEPIVAAGPGSFPDELLRRAGAVNVVTEGGRYPTLGIERVMALDPDVIVDASSEESPHEERITAEAPGWRELRAVKTGHVVPLRDEVVLRPGPRIGQGLAELERALHPDLRP